MGWAKRGRHAPPVKDRAASSAPGKQRNSGRLSGHAAANARRMRLAVSTTRAGDFQETKTQRRELGSGQFPDFGNGVAHGQHQPISGRMEHETDLVGERRTANWCDSEASCVLCSLIRFSALAARAIQAVVDPLGRADIEAGGRTKRMSRTEHRPPQYGRRARRSRSQGLCLVGASSV